MATTALSQRSARRPDDAEVELTHPVSVNIKPILDSVAGKLTDEEIDQWFVDLEKANEEHGLHLEMTCDGKLIISPMVNRDGGMAEGPVFCSVVRLGRGARRRSIRSQREYASAGRLSDTP